jgi:(R)-2-hydroxyacyl-CoA dehydratese activating ATPase
MISVGCDVGATFTKVVLLGPDRLLGSRVLRTTGRTADSVDGLVGELLAEAGVARRDLAFVGTTGSGGAQIPGADFYEDELTCVGAAVGYYLSGALLALQVGGQSIAAVQINDDGEVVSFRRNDKCAAGTGRFLEMMSQRLGMDLASLDDLAAQATEPRDVSSQCVVFAESEAISHINAGVPVPDIVAGICGSIGRIAASQGRRVPDTCRFTLTGGVARFRSVVQVVQERLELDYVAFPQNPQLAAALGAALLEDGDDSGDGEG